MQLYDNEAEKAIIGQVFIDNKVFDETNLATAHFFDPKHKEVWAAFLSLHSDGVILDPVAVGEYLSRKGVLDSVGGLAYFGQLIAEAPTTSDNAKYYADIVRDYALRRDIGAIPELLGRNKTNSGEDLLRTLRSELDRLEGGVSRELPTLAEILETEVANIKSDVHAGISNPTGLLTGLGIEKIVPGGIPTDKVTLIFGESGNFKTTFKNNLIWGIAEHSKGSVLDISLEDSDELTAQRALAKATGISYGKIAVRDIDSSRLCELRYNEEVARRVIMGGDIPPDIDDIIRQARYYKRTAGLVAVVIDYIQLLEGNNQKEMLDALMRKCQLSGRRDGIAYILISQVKQDVDQRAQNKQDTRPRITDMIGSSSMRFGGKVSIGVYRPSKYETVPTKKSSYNKLYFSHHDGPAIYANVLELWFVKNVLGEPDVFLPCIVTPETGSLVPMPQELKELLE